MDELIFASATALAKAIRAKEVSSREVVDAYLQRIEAVNPRLNAVVQVAADAARDEARAADSALARGEIKGPLHVSYWIDAQHRIRKVTEVETVAGQHVTTTIVYTAINQPVQITVPPASQVRSSSIPGL